MQLKLLLFKYNFIQRYESKFQINFRTIQLNKILSENFLRNAKNKNIFQINIFRTKNKRDERDES